MVEFNTLCISTFERVLRLALFYKKRKQRLARFIFQTIRIIVTYMDLIFLK